MSELDPPPPPSPAFGAILDALLDGDINREQALSQLEAGAGASRIENLD